MIAHRRLVVRVGRAGGRHFHDRHHAAIFVRQNVAMDHIVASVVDEAAAHLEKARHLDRLTLLVYDRFACLHLVGLHMLMGSGTRPTRSGFVEIEAERTVYHEQRTA